MFFKRNIFLFEKSDDSIYLHSYNQWKIGINYEWFTHLVEKS